MANNDWKSRLNVVYSTNPDFNYQQPNDEQSETLPASQQDLRVWLDRKMRGGKQATIIRGFKGSDDELKELARMLKNRLGVGGAAKEGEVIIQGDMRDKIIAILLTEGYKAKKAGS